MKTGVLTVASVVVLALGAAWAEESNVAQHVGPLSSPSVTKAVAVLSPTKGNNVSGVVTFEVVKSGVKIVADVTGLTPGLHGFHVHEFGDCTAPDATSAGGHFNPHHMQHGGPDAAVRHAGDLGNLDANASGQAHYERVDTMISLDGADSIIGRAVTVHEKADDLKTQPTGNAGARVACGAIGVAKP